VQSSDNQQTHQQGGLEMPITINVGLTKKIGQPDYGSLGATCHVDFEVDHGLLQHDLEAFHRQVRNAYVACAQAVNDELTRQQASGTTSQATNGANGHALASHNGSNDNGHVASNGNPNGNGRNGQGSVASEKQLSYAKQLAKSIQGLGIRGLDNLAQRMYNKPLVALTTLDASGLIDSLKAVKDGKIDISTVLGAAA
jgi:hypothetical protein